MKNAVLGDLWLSIDEEIAASGGSTYGIITKLIDINKRQFPWLTRNMVNYYRTKAVKELMLPPEEIGESHESRVSGLTSCIMTRTSENSCSEQRASENIEDSGENISRSEKNKGGRPMGSTISHKESRKRRKIQALNHAANKFKELKEQQSGPRVKWGAYDSVIRDTNALFDLHTPDKISKEIVRTRLRNGRNIMVAHRGPVSPMIKVEAYLVEVILSLSAMRQPVTPPIALELINSAVKGTATEQQILD